MSDTIYKEVINTIEKIKDKSGRLVNSRLTFNWFEKNQIPHLYYEIISKTSSCFPSEILSSERIYHYIHKLNSFPLCKTCCNTTKFYTINEGYHEYCSVACRQSDDKFIKQKSKKTCLLKYGVDNPTKNIQIANKISIAHSKKTKEQIDLSTIKRENTSIKKYGVKNYSTINQKTKKNYTNSKTNKTLKHRADIIPLFDLDNEYVPWIDRKYKCNKCGDIFSPIDIDHRGHSNDARLRCIKCFPKFKSKFEIDISNFLDNCFCDYFTNINTIINGELDFYIPKYNLAIEFNGIFWHSENNNYRNIPKEYHLNKTIECKNKNIQLLHIFQNEWDDPTKKSIWKSLIKNKLTQSPIKIYARKCTIKEISSETSNNFLELNHLQGKSNASIRYGLFYNENLVSLLCISKSRFNKKYTWEITRFCNKIDHNVVGGFSKLLTYFRNNHQGSIITYADKRYSNGDLYLKNGFIELKDSPPNYWYFKSPSTKLISRIQYQKHKLKHKLIIFDDNKNEWENMKLNNFNRIWDCGNKVFVYK